MPRIDKLISQLVLHRPKIFKRSGKAPGLPPGTVVYTGDEDFPTEISLIRYSKDDFQEETNLDVLPVSRPGQVNWYNITGLSDTDRVQSIGEQFFLHPLVLEDIVNTGQRPKVEDQDNYTYLVLKMLSTNGHGHIQTEQVSLVLGSNFILSFQERPGDVFETVRNRLRKEKAKIRERGADYLFYALFDAIVDHYFIVLEKISERLEVLEEKVFKGEEGNIVQELHLIRRNLVLLRKSVWPLREVLSTILREKTRLIRKETLTYFRDIYDHTIQVIDTIESLRDVATSVREMYMTEISNRMNNVMKVLTIIATLFIPITFVAGIYGMNFENMPELKWEYGYPAVWGVFIVITAGLIVFFKRKNWL